MTATIMETSFLNNAHASTVDTVFKQLETDKEGISSKEAERRIDQVGLNKLPDPKKANLLKIILHQLLNPLIFILTIAAFASIIIGEYSDASFIFLVIAINSILGAYQEYNAEKSAEGLRKILQIKASVIRNGIHEEINSELLAPGDIVFLESGVKVPADMRLFELKNLSIDESFLTGESIATEKHKEPIPENSAVSEQNNMAFAGATVMTGRGKGIVTATAVNTEVGKIALNINKSKSAKAPLIQRMESFIKQISIFFTALGLILAIVLRLQGMDYASIFFFVIALAVSAIPEGLPVALTVALSIATKRMSKRNVIVRKLTSVESLGSCTVIASDKTGTLTLNEQTVKLIALPNKKEYKLTGQGYNGEGTALNTDDTQLNEEEKRDFKQIITAAILASEGYLLEEDESWRHHGDAMDVAILAASFKSGEDPSMIRSLYPYTAQIPYESENKYSANFYLDKSTVKVALKGAVETVLEFCNSTSFTGSSGEFKKQDILSQAEVLAGKGYRVLAVAKGDCPKFELRDEYTDKDLPDLTFLGILCFIDPLRPEAKDAVSKCHMAGIKVLMVTGDHPETASSIASDLGIDNGAPTLTGKKLSELSEESQESADNAIRESRVFARVSPMQKLEIVDSLIRNKEFVAVTGDGVNDAPALKRANIGVAMGGGTDVAKDVGAMIVLDDNFSSIVAGVEEGRFAYDNVRKVIYLLISTGASEITLFITSIIAGLPLPLLAVQLLWLNLVTNGIQDVALACEGGEPGAMKKQPRKTSEKIFNPLMLQQTIISGLTVGLITFGLWYYLIEVLKMNELHARNLILLLMVFMENIHVFNCRSETVSAFKVPLSRNWLLIGGVFISQSIHIISMQIPVMKDILQIEPITVTEWFSVLIFAIPTLIVMECYKLLQKKTAK